MTEADKKYYDKIKNTEVSPEQHFKMAVLQVMSHMDMFFKSIAFEYLEKVKVSFSELMGTVKQLPSSEYINQVDKELDINSPLSQYLNAYFGVQPGDDEALRYKLHDMYMKRYDDRTFSVVFHHTKTHTSYIIHQTYIHTSNKHTYISYIKHHTSH